MAVEQTTDLEAELRDLQNRLADLQARLSRSFKGGRAPGTRVEVLLVEIGALSAAFELDPIREVVPVAALKPIPEAPPWVLGALNLRGRTTPIIHIGSKLSGGAPDFELEDLIVVTDTELGAAGFVVTAVGTIVDALLDDATSLNETPHASYVVGSFSHLGNPRVLLGVPELLRYSDLAFDSGKKATS